MDPFTSSKIPGADGDAVVGLLGSLALIRAAAHLEALITLSAFWGVCLLLREGAPIAVVFLLLWISQPLVYYVIQADERYRFPIEWSILLCAGHAAMFICRDIQRRFALRQRRFAPRDRGQETAMG